MWFKKTGSQEDWVFSSGTTGCTAGDFNKSYDLQIQNLDLYFHVNGNGPTNPGGGKIGFIQSISLNNWYHVVLVYTGSIMYGYVNGVLKFNDTRTLNTTNSPLYIANDSLSCTVNLFDGSIDDVRIYNRALTADELRDLYLSGVKLTGAVLRNMKVNQ